METTNVWAQAIERNTHTHYCPLCHVAYPHRHNDNCIVGKLDMEPSDFVPGTWYLKFHNALCKETGWISIRRSKHGDESALVIAWRNKFYTSFGPSSLGHDERFTDTKQAIEYLTTQANIGMEHAATY